MSFMAVAVAGSAVVGYAASRSATKAAAGAAADANETAREAAQLQYDLGKETLDFNKQYYNEVIKPAAQADMDFRGRMLPKLETAFDKQEQFADQQRQDYLDNWRPLEQQVRQDAMEYDSEGNVNRRMGIAAANVNQQFSNAAGQSARLLSRYGLNPNSSAFARTNANLVNQQALASAGMQTGAAFDTMDRGIALRAGAANFGRNMPNTSASFSQIGNQTAGAGSNVSAGGVNTAVAGGNFMNNGYGTAGNLISSSGNLSLGVGRNYANEAGMVAQGVGQLFSGVGQGLGMWGRGGFKMPSGVQASFSQTGLGSSGFGTGLAYGNEDMGLYLADGGHVGDVMEQQTAAAAAANAGPAGAWTLPPQQRMGLANGGQPVPPQGGIVRGPGGPRDDMVPAMLSPREFVLNEGAVKHFGVDKLNKMNAIGLQNQAQRGLVRSA